MMPGGEIRWTCVLRTKEIIVALSIDVVINNADGSIENFLNRSYYGLYCQLKRGGI
jgi:hypothetical protein